MEQTLRGVKELKNRYEKVTFDRTTAIRNSETEFMAIGHPFTNTVLQYCGSADFGGLAGSQVIEQPHALSGSGALFHFTVKMTKEISGKESTFFEFVPVFVYDDGTVAPKEAVQAIVSELAKARTPLRQTGSPVRVAEELFEKAKDQALEEYAQYDLWDDDVFCLDALRVEVM